MSYLKASRQTGTVSLKNLGSIDCEKLAAELPAFMLYSISVSGGHVAPHEALALLERDETVSSYLSEFRKLSRIYAVAGRLIPNQLVALEKIAEELCPKVLLDIVKRYVFLYTARGSSKTVVADITSEVIASFKNYVSTRFSLIKSVVELVVLLLTSIVMGVFIASFLAANFSAIALASLVVAVAAIAMAAFTRIRVFETYLNKSRADVTGVAADILALTSLALSLAANKPAASLLLALLSLTLKAAQLSCLARKIGGIGRIVEVLKILSESSLILASDKLLQQKLRSLGHSVGKVMAYTILKGRTPELLRREGEHKFLQLVAHIVMHVERSGGLEYSILRAARSLLEVVHSLSRETMARMAIATVTIGVVVIATQLSLGLLTSILNSNMPATLTSYSPTGLIAGFPDKTAIRLVVHYLTVSGVIVSYAVTYMFTRRTWYNLAPPVIALGTAIALIYRIV